MRRRSWRAAWLALAASLVLPAAAEPAPEPLQVPGSAPPTFASFTPRDGLGDEIWSTVGVGPDGFVWAGSAATIARFDGYRWHPHPDPPARSLVRDMANDADGNLWAIFEREGLARFDGKQWQRIGESRFYQRFSTLGEGEHQELWVAHNGGLAKLVDGRWVEDPGNDGGPSARAIAFTRTLTIGGEPREWLGTADQGLWYRSASGRPGPWRRHEDPGLRRMLVTDLMLSQDGDREELWVLSYGGGVARLRADGMRTWRADTGELPSEAIYSAVESRDADGERSVWMASRAGLLRFRGDRVDVFDRRHGLPSDAVRGIKLQHGKDGVDSLWLATEGGLARATLTASPWHTVSLLGARDNGSFGVLVEPNGRGGERLWVGSSRDGLALLDEGRWRHFRHGTGELRGRSVRGLWRLPDDDGRMRRLLLQPGAPLQEITDDLRIVALPTPWPVTAETGANFMTARQLDGQVEWWVATAHSGVYRLRGGSWTHYPTLGRDSPGSVHGLVAQVDQAGQAWLWAADSHGLARFDGERWERLPAALRLPREGFRALSLFEDEGRQVLWAASTNHSLLRLDVQDPRAPRRLPDDELPPPPDPTLYSALRDSRGRIYVCTNNGIQQLTPRPEGGYSERVFRRRDGLVHDECNTNGQFIDSHDRYWVGTLGGLAMYDPDAQPPARSAAPKPLHLTEVRVDGRSVTVPDDGRLVLPPGQHELRVDFSLLTGLREGESRYRTQLLGYDAAPTRWSAERSRSFSALPPGQYRFRVEARDYAGIVAKPRELALQVPPLWWQHRGLQAMAAVVALLLLAAVVRLYNRGLRSRQRQLQQQVAERTADLNDANLRLTELSYLDPLTGVANRRRLVEAMAAAMQRARERGMPIGLIVADVDHFKQYNDRFGHLAGDAALRAIAGAMGSAMREQDLVARFGGEEFACLMVDAEAGTVQRIAERMRVLVEALPPRALGNDSQTLTLSAGVLSRIPGPDDTPESFLHAADQALYQAKAGGRNRVALA